MESGLTGARHSRVTTSFNQSLTIIDNLALDNEPAKPAFLTSKRKQIATLLRQIKQVALWSAVIAMPASLLVYVDSEWNHMPSFSMTISTTMRVAIMLLSLVQVLLVVKYHFLRVKMLSCLRKVYAPSSWLGLCSIPSLRFLFFLEVSVNSLFIPIFIDSSRTYYELGTQAELSVEDFIMPFVYLRLYHVVRGCYYVSRLNSARAVFYMELHNIQSHFQWLAKMHSKSSGFLTAFSVSVMFFVVSGLILRIYEHSVPGSDFSLWTSLWFSAVSQCGIGYGDVTPKTHLGRIATCITIFIGIFILSSLIKGLQMRCNPTHNEVTLMLAIKDRLVNRKKYRHQAAVLIQRRWRLHVKRLRKESSFQLMLAYADYLLMFRKLRKSELMLAHHNAQFQTLLEPFQKRLHIHFSELIAQNQALKTSVNVASRLVSGIYGMRLRIETIKHHISRMNGDTSGPMLSRSSRNSFCGRSGKVKLKRVSDAAIKKILIRRSLIPGTCSSRSIENSDS